MKNIQNEVQKIHAQYGTTEKANYEIQKLVEQAIAESEAALEWHYPPDLPQDKLKAYLCEIRRANNLTKFIIDTLPFNSFTIRWQYLPAAYQAEKGVG